MSKNASYLDRFVKADKTKDIFMQSFAKRLNMPHAVQFNQIISKVVGLNKQILLSLNLSQYKGTIKIDGLRTLLIIDEKTHA